MFGSNYLPRLLSLLVAIGLVGSLAMTTATAADNSISKADLVQRELPTFLGSLNLTINTTLQDVKPRLANVTTANLTTDCYEPGIVGLDNKFVVLDHTIAETIVYYFVSILQFSEPLMLTFIVFGHSKPFHELSTRPMSASVSRRCSARFT